MACRTSESSISDPHHERYARLKLVAMMSPAACWSRRGLLILHRAFATSILLGKRDPVRPAAQFGKGTLKEVFVWSFRTG